MLPASVGISNHIQAPLHASSDLEEKYDKVVEENKKLKEEIKKLHDLIKELEKKLFSQSPASRALSTPSSKQFPKSNRSPKGSRPRGAPKGHPGKSLKIPIDVDQTTVHSFEACPYCNNTALGKETEGWTQTVWDIVQMPITVTRHIFMRRWCPTCKKKVAAQCEETLPKRNYGPNLATLVGFLSKLGLPLPKIQLLIQTIFNHTISQPELMGLSNLVGDHLETEYQHLHQKVRQATSVNADETSFRIDGINNWCWTYTWEDGVLYVIHPSRGKACPNEVLGTNYHGAVGRDGWYAYDSLDCEQQLCYIHVNRNFQRTELKRSVKDRGFLDHQVPQFTKKGRPSKRLKELLLFIDEIRSIMRAAVKFTEREPAPDSEERFWMLEQLLDRFDAVMDEEWCDVDVLRLRKFLLKHRAHFFTFVIFPEISWENNAAERAVRKIATIRNNSGGRRSRKGADTVQVLLSVFETWRKRGHDVFQKTKSMLTRSVEKGAYAISVA